MKTDELREKFLRFFESKRHNVFPSDSLIPQDDRSVLFTPAGMNQFKPMFLGEVNAFRRAVSCQKCLRTGDLDKVGKTPAHHTFFEMLGNFSFGDYFKEEAIAFAWEFLTGLLKISPDRFWVSVYEEDSEACGIWFKKIGIPQEKILKLGQIENFWPSDVIVNGPDGPCGPCSEIFFDRGKGTGCGKIECSPLCPCGRFVEIWNLVFTQFERREDNKGKGILRALGRKNIDTGMGLERMAAVLQGVRTNFEIDIFKPIVKEIEKETRNQPALAKRSGPGKPETNNRESITRSAIYAIADHIRAVVFAINDGALPSNEERGYIVRKLIRKSVWHTRTLGAEDVFLYRLVPVVAKVMQYSYPDLIKRRENISQIVLAEEERFRDTLENGINILNSLLENLKKNKINTVSGEEAFRLYDTCGFPLELTGLIASQEGFSLDKEGFSAKMEAQRRKSKEKSQISKEIFASDKVSLNDKVKIRIFKPSIFTGYDNLEVDSRISDIAKDGQSVRAANTGEEVEIVLEKTPFYAEAGGQTADKGVIEAKDKIIEIDNTTRKGESIIHHGKIVKGKIEIGDSVLARVDQKRRLDIARNHTATHLLQSALRAVLGTHLKQAGSWVGADGLRFDFRHFKAVSQEQLIRVEELVNTYIRGNDRLSVEVMKKNLARKSGALAFFADKYSDEVRVVSIGEYSKELCGGTHLRYTGEIGAFLILNESSVAQGVRRIEAVTGSRACSEIRQMCAIFKEITSKYKISKEDIPDYIGELLQEIRCLDKENRNLKLEVFRESQVRELIAEAEKRRGSFDGKKLVFKRYDEPAEILREYMDIIKEKSVSNTFIILASAALHKSTVLIALTKDLSGSFDASKAAREIARIIGGSGGGRRDLAQAGAKGTEKLDFLGKEDNLLKVVEAAQIK